uniref:Integrin alpha-2 domain-containing protein n=1 Tax=Oncorhynchus tshawytscha TaxID=74940 RepID=A0A8C8K2C8_ONCTS
MGLRFIQCISYLSLLLHLEWTHVSAFNLDTENVIEKKGEPGSLFGFSLAMHCCLHPRPHSIHHVLLVGAPRAKALRGQKAKITGGLYNCDTASTSSSCSRVQFDNDEDVNTESKENQWMGVTVNSQGPGGKIVTCAHRYQRRLFVNTAQESRDITGRCYVLSQDLTIGTESDEDGGNWRFCEGRARGHERFGSCQQGLSATFTRDYHYLVFGAPGAYNWKGVVRVEQKNNTLLEMGFYDDGPYEVGDENRLDPDLVPVPANSYLGFSLDSGKAITKKGQLTVVAGAPRANHSGAVVLLKKETEASTMLSPEHILEGEGLASSFGYDLAVVDLTGDGWEDIVVGAPQFFEKDGEVGGAIYVYVNKGGDWSKVTPTRIDGPRDSMFGLAVENLGDLNLDGYQDIAVGAPYYDSGSGKVFIYHGSAQGINIKPAQVLSGVPSETKLFGYSLAGNMDLDRNSYPDLAVGSLSDSVFVYRTRPVISIQKVVKTTPKEIDLTKKNCGNSICNCPSLSLPLSLLSSPLSLFHSLSFSLPSSAVAYSFEVEAERRKKGLPPRVTFSTRSSDDNDYQSTGVLILMIYHVSLICTLCVCHLQENIKDKLRGIPIDVTVEIKNSKRKRRALPELPPILDSNEPITARAEVSFLKEGCGSDNVCQSNVQLQHRFCYREPNKDVFHPLPDGVPVVSLSDQKDIALEITVTNQNGDDAHEAALVASFPPSLSYSASRSAPNAVSDTSPLLSQALSHCELGNPFKRGSEATFYIILSTAGISLNTTELEIDLKLETTSDQQNVARVKAKAKVVIELLLSLTGVAKPSQVYFTGEVKGESAMHSEGDIGSPIEYEFRVINLGKPLKTYGSAALIVNWPKETVEGKWLLYLMKIDSRGLEQITCSPEREINSLAVKESSTRRRRAVVETDKPQEGTILYCKVCVCVLQSCEDGAKCVEIRCPLQGLDSNAVILLRSRLWNSTFLEEYSKLNYLDVIVKASLRVDGAAKNMVLRNAETQVLGQFHISNTQKPTFPFPLTFY